MRQERRGGGAVVGISGGLSLLTHARGVKPRIQNIRWRMGIQKFLVDEEELRLLVAEEEAGSHRAQSRTIKSPPENSCCGSEMRCELLLMLEGLWILRLSAVTD